LSIQKLQEQLESALETYRNEIQFNRESFGAKQSVTAADLEELGRQTFYALNDFKNYIISYLKERN